MIFSGTTKKVIDKYRPKDTGTPESRALLTLFDHYPQSTIRVFEHWRNKGKSVSVCLKLAKASFTPQYEAVKKELGV